jgi:hypothetical protein
MTLHTAVFKQQIWGFFSNDMDSCLLVSKDILIKKNGSKFTGGLNFTAALTVLSVVDMCASYYVGKEAGLNDIAEFMKKYFLPYDPLFNYTTFSKKVYEIFRNGLSHQWSPKMSGVSMDFNEKKWIVFVRGETPILNIPSFLKIVKMGFKSYETDLDNNSRLRDLFETRYNKIINQDKLAITQLLKIINS